MTKTDTNMNGNPRLELGNGGKDVIDDEFERY